MQSKLTNYTKLAQKATTLDCEKSWKARTQSGENRLLIIDHHLQSIFIISFIIIHISIKSRPTHHHYHLFPHIFLCFLSSTSSPCCIQFIRALGSGHLATNICSTNAREHVLTGAVSDLDASKFMFANLQVPHNFIWHLHFCKCFP